MRDTLAVVVLSIVIRKSSSLAVLVYVKAELPMEEIQLRFIKTITLG